MKIAKSIKSTLLIGAVAVSVSVLCYSCGKEDQGPTGSVSNEQETKMKAQTIADKISNIKIVGDNGKVIGTVSTQSGGFSFADAHEGFHFSSSNGVQYVTDGSGGGSIYVSAGAFGGNSGGGAIVAGNTSMEINYTFCMSASDSGMGLNFFGPAFTGVSMVFGISGNFDAILNGEVNDSTEMTDIFNGFAMYIIYDDQASGTYKIVNWIEDLDDADSDPDAFANKGFAWVADFQNFSLFFSMEGTLNVSGGSIGFDGKYLQFSPEEGADDPFDLGDDATLKEVDGMGTMGCN